MAFMMWDPREPAAVTRLAPRRVQRYAAMLGLVEAQRLAVHASALVSIRCLFYAILSVLIYIHLRYRGLGGFPATPGAAASSERWDA